MTDKEVTLQKIREGYERSKMLDLRHDAPSPYVLIKNMQDLTKLNENTRSVGIDQSFQQDYSPFFHAIKQLPNITNLEIFDTIPYIFLDNEDLENIERLRLIVKATEPFVAFSLPKLKELLLLSADRPDLLTEMSEKVYFDFSFFPSLESLYISGWINLDSKCFQTLQSLNYLTFKQEELIDLDWLRYVPPPKSLKLPYDSIESVNPIVRYQSQLETINLYSAYIAANDIQDLAQMPNLRTLDIKHCPISAEQEEILRDSAIQNITINNVDSERRLFVSSAYELGMETGNILYHREKNAERERSKNIFGRLSVDAARPWEERALELIQIKFSERWENAKNWRFRPESDIMESHRTEFCRAFLESALNMYPSLLLTREMSEVLYAQRTIPKPDHTDTPVLVQRLIKENRQKKRTDNRRSEEPKLI